MKYEVCRYCGAHLDPGEKCDCQKEEQKNIRMIEQYTEEEFQKTKDGQMRFIL